MIHKKIIALSVFLLGLATLPLNITASEPHVLNIPVDRQDYPLSCEAASLKMALVYKGSLVTEDQLIAIIGNDTTPRSFSSSPRDSGGPRGVWGDPDKHYVGSLHGRQNATGYGVHWDPIARAAQVFYPSSQAFRGKSSAQVAAEVAAGNPIIVWGVIGRAHNDGWRTPDGRFVGTMVGEHTRVVIGFYGNAQNPTAFILNDPLGRRITWSRQQFEANFATFGNTGVVVK